MAEHIRDNADSIDADAWLVDGFGQAHPVTAHTLVGRQDQNQLVVLAKSVSKKHAELVCKDQQWSVRDVSTNGTFVGGTRVQGRAGLAHKSIVRFGDVAMWFLREVVTKPRALSHDTVPLSDVLAYHVTPNTGPEVLLAGDRLGGTIRRRQGSSWGPERSLTSLQYQMFRLLCAAAVADANAPTEIRGCVPTERFVAELTWSSSYADGNNVRQQVVGLRGALDELGANLLVRNQPGRGYYIAGSVTSRMGTS